MSKMTKQRLHGVALLFAWMLTACWADDALVAGAEQAARSLEEAQLTQRLGTDPFLTTDASTYSARAPIGVVWSAPANHSGNDWIGLYAVGAPDGAYLAYQHVPAGDSGILTFPAPAQAGMYEFRYIPSGATGSSAESNSFTVSGYSLVINSTEYVAGSNISVAWSAPSNHSGSDWIGLYAVGAPDSSYLSRSFVPTSSSGSVSFIAPSQAGAYEFRYLPSGTTSSAAVSSSFTVTTYSLAIISTEQAAGSSISVAWSAPANHSGSDWIGLYSVGAASTSYLVRSFVPAGSSGSLTFTVPSQAGTYEFRYLPNGGYTSVSTSSSFVVRGHSLSTNAADYPSGSPISVAWTAPTNHSADDWIGLYAVGAPNGAYLAFQHVPSGSSGLLTFATPSQVGAYEFRYIPNGATTHFATSNSFTIRLGACSGYNFMSYRGQNGREFFCSCGPVGNGAVWGTDLYTDDSDACVAGVHAGAITSHGGDITVVIRPGQTSYSGSTRNGVTTYSWGAWSGSLSVLVGRSTPTGQMRVNRWSYTATALPSGKVLAAGGYNTNSTEMYDPSTGQWTTSRPMLSARMYHTATLLPSGRVLVAGGTPVDNSSAIASTELFDPSTGTWSWARAMTSARLFHTATSLPSSGKVLVVGGETDTNTGNPVTYTSAELYDPGTNTWAPVASMGTPRTRHTATLLLSGKILVSGGVDTWGAQGSAEVYDPSTNTWSPTGPMKVARRQHVAAQLPSGKVLVVGGTSNPAQGSVAEVYDPVTNQWSEVQQMPNARYDGLTATVLPSGRVLVAGGRWWPSTLVVDVYEPSTGSWRSLTPLHGTRYSHQAVLLPSGGVLLAGGHSSSTAVTAEIYTY